MGGNNLFRSITTCLLFMYNRCARTQRQKGTDDCRLFALAFTYTLASGQQPQDFNFDQESMRGHLIHCFEAGVMLPFPSRMRRNKAKFQKEYLVGIYCSCRMPDHTPTTSMIQCSGCSEWYHLHSCVTVPRNKLKKGVKWFCYAC